MTKPTTIYLVRHGESESNQNDLISGSNDNPRLTNKGRAQAAEAKAELASIDFTTFYTSSLDRAIETGEIIYGSKVPAGQSMDVLREKSFGEFDGKHKKHLEELYSAVIALPEEERWGFKQSETMESDQEVADRFVTALQHIAQNHPGDNVLVVSHGICIRILLMKLGYASHVDFPPGSFKNAGYVVIDHKNTELKLKKVVGHVKPQDMIK